MNSVIFIYLEWNIIGIDNNNDNMDIFLEQDKSKKSKGFNKVKNSE